MPDDQVEAQIAKEAKETVAITGKALGKLEQQLVAKWGEIQALQFKYNTVRKLRASSMRGSIAMQWVPVSNMMRRFCKLGYW